MLTIDDGIPIWRCMVFAPTCSAAYKIETKMTPNGWFFARKRDQDRGETVSGRKILH